MSEIPESISCPNCGRSVEPGFRFCDSCGQKLELPPQKVDPPKPPPAPTPEPLKPDEAPTWHVPIEDTSKLPPLLERMRHRREGRSEDDDELFAPPKAAEPPDEPTTGPIVIPATPKPAPPPPPPSAPPPPPAAPPPPPPSPVVTPTREPVAARPAAQVIEAPKPAPTWRPVVKDEPAPQKFGPRTILVWLLHLVIAFASGLALLLAAGAVASLLSNGRTALLELRGLPIFLAGATAVIVFTLLRTGKVRLTASRQATAITVIVGFVLIVAGSAIAYRPADMHSVQTRLDRVLRVYGPTEKEAVDGFEGDITDWNAERDHYRSDILAPVLGSKPDVPKFRVDASASEETMKGIVDRMMTHADTANNLRMRDALHGLASIYDDQMSGINLLTRGVLAGDQGLVAQGDARFKDAGKRSLEFFQLRVRPLLERAGLDSASFESAVSG